MQGYDQLHLTGPRSVAILRKLNEDPSLFGYNLAHGRDDAGHPILGPGGFDLSMFDSGNPDPSDAGPDIWARTMDRLSVGPNGKTSGEQMDDAARNEENGVDDTNLASIALARLAERRGFHLSNTTAPDAEY